MSTEQGKAYADEQGISFLEASAKTASNVEASFLKILSEIYHKKATKEQQAAGTPGGTTPRQGLDMSGQTPKKKPCCA